MRDQKKKVDSMDSDPLIGKSLEKTPIGYRVIEHYCDPEKYKRGGITKIIPTPHFTKKQISLTDWLVIKKEKYNKERNER